MYVSMFGLVKMRVDPNLIFWFDKLKIHLLTEPKQGSLQTPNLTSWFTKQVELKFSF